MPGLADLPIELLLSICHGFDDFDDVLRLRRCCRRLHRLVNVPEYRGSILKMLLKNLSPSQFSTEHGIRALAKQITKHNSDLHRVILRWQSLKALQQISKAPFDSDYKDLVDALIDDSNYCGVPLRWAASRGIEPLVQMMLNEIEDVNAIGDIYHTPLGSAVKHGHEGVVRMLLDKGAETERKDESVLMTPLAVAVVHGHFDIVDLLLGRGADIESRQRGGKTPLCLAAEGRRATMVKHLLQRGAQIRVKTDKGKSPLHVAASKGNEEALSDLLDWCSTHGCEDLITSRDKDSGATPLHDICRADCSVDIIRRLLDKGAQICAFDYAEKSPLMMALRNDDFAISEAEDDDELFEKIKLLSTDPDVITTPTKTRQETSLHLVAESPDPRIIIWLLEHGGHPVLNQPDRFGMTPLLVALDHNSGRVIDSLLALPDIDLSCQSSSGETALHFAARKCTPTEISSILSLNPALLNAVNGKGATPLLVAFRAEQLENCECLLESKADACIADNSGQDPLRWASEEAEDTEFLELLLDDDLVILDSQGNTLLHKAVRGPSVERVVSLLESSDINSHDRNTSGDSALHTAVQNGNDEVAEEIVQALLQRDNTSTLASISNNSGKTALDFALERGRKDTIEILVQSKWNSTLGVEWNPESVWIRKWSDQPWHSDLLRIIEAVRPCIAAQTKLLVDQCGGPPLTISRNDPQEYIWKQSRKQPYISIQIPPGNSSPVRRIVFTMVSNDQGWSDRHSVNQRNEGSYCGSRTWFEAGITKPSDANQVTSPREIQRNIHTSSDPRQHTVIWDVQNTTPGLREWLNNIQGGDVLNIYPKAYQYGWRNCVREVTVVVYYERS